MGKRQHQKDKMYLTYTEWSTLYGGKKEGPPGSQSFRRLPFDHCSVSLQPFQNPYCDRDGNIFEYEAILKYLKRYKHNPITGKPLEAKKLIKLNFHKNAEGVYHCPVLYKLFTKQSHIVVIATTGNVFSNEAVEQLNIKTKNWKDLLTDEPFQKSDIIPIQDPCNLSKFNIASFHHVKKDLRLIDEEALIADKDPEGRLKTVCNETREILDELKREYKPVDEGKGKSKESCDQFNAAHYSTGMVAAGFTSTVMEPKTTIEAAILHEDVVRYERVKKKGYVRLMTNLGPLNLQLHCDLVPKTCENFLKHCQNGYYNNTIFHRSIRNFMIQGGDPTGKGTGGTSIWGKCFEDEFIPHLNHTGRGILSMANSGANTNKSQFFITYRSCRHLDKKHTVFGQLVGGMDTLTEMENVEVDNKDKPIHDIVITKTHVFVDPYQEADDKLNEERQTAKKNDKKSDPKEAEKKLVTLGSSVKPFRTGVGKFINPQVLPNEDEKAEESTEPVNKKKKILGYDFNNFGTW